MSSESFVIPKVGTICNTILSLGKKNIKRSSVDKLVHKHTQHMLYKLRGSYAGRHIWITSPSFACLSIFVYPSVCLHLIFVGPRTLFKVFPRLSYGW